MQATRSRSRSQSDEFSPEDVAQRLALLCWVQASTALEASAPVRGPHSDADRATRLAAARLDPSACIRLQGIVSDMPLEGTAESTRNILHAVRVLPFIAGTEQWEGPTGDAVPQLAVGVRLGWRAGSLSWSVETPFPYASRAIASACIGRHVHSDASVLWRRPAVLGSGWVPEAAYPRDATLPVLRHRQGSLAVDDSQAAIGAILTGNKLAVHASQ